MLTQVERLIYADGKKDGYLLAEKKMAELTNKLLRENRLDAVLKMSKDTAYRHQLYTEYNIH